MKVLARNQVIAGSKKIEDCIVDFELFSDYGHHNRFDLSAITRAQVGNRVRELLGNVLNNAKSVAGALNRSSGIIFHDWEIDRDGCGPKEISVISESSGFHLVLHFNQHSDVIGQKMRPVDNGQGTTGVLRIRAMKNGTYQILIWEDDGKVFEDTWLDLNAFEEAFGFDFKPEDFKK